MRKKKQKARKVISKINWIRWGVLALFCAVCTIGVNNEVYAQRSEDALQTKILKKKQKAKRVRERKEPRFNEKMRDKEVMKGRLDSIRPDKIVITYQPSDQAGDTRQTFYIRNENTQFANRSADKLKAGDIVAIRYDEIEWNNEENKVRRERIAKRVRFIKDRAAAEKEDAPKKKRKGTKRVKNTQAEQGPQ